MNFSKEAISSVANKKGPFLRNKKRASDGSITTASSNSAVSHQAASTSSTKAQQEEKDNRTSTEAAWAEYEKRRVVPTFPPLASQTHTTSTSNEASANSSFSPPYFTSSDSPSSYPLFYPVPTLYHQANSMYPSNVTPPAMHNLLTRKNKSSPHKSASPANRTPVVRNPYSSTTPETSSTTMTGQTIAAVKKFRAVGDEKFQPMK